MSSNYQDRILLELLDNTTENQIIKKILKSPLGLANDLTKAIFEKKLNEKEKMLDKIKNFAAGITRANNLANGYTLAKYYPYMFSFQQFFHSSFRARQGKVLEEMLKNILLEYAKCNKVPDKVQEMQTILETSFGQISNSITLDVDVMGEKNQKIILIQLRSRDDTGGTTAKGSLVELLRSLLRLKTIPQHEIFYLIGVWDERNSQQKNSTIEKMYSSLKDFIPDKDVFIKDIEKGYEIADKIIIQLAYNTENIQKAIYEWTETNDENIFKSIEKIVNFVENWDDLWLSYSISNLELQTQQLKGLFNVDLLNAKWQSLNLKFDFSNYENLIKSVDNATQKIAPLWIENSIPLESLADKTNYIRDLILLKACYEKK